MMTLPSAFCRLKIVLHEKYTMNANRTLDDEVNWPGRELSHPKHSRFSESEESVSLSPHGLTIW